MCCCHNPAAHAVETFLGSGATGAKPPQCTKELLRECSWQAVLTRRTQCGSSGSSSRGRVCRKDAGALPAQPESNGIPPTESHVPLSSARSLTDTASQGELQEEIADTLQGVLKGLGAQAMFSSILPVAGNDERSRRKRQQINIWLSAWYHWQNLGSLTVGQFTGHQGFWIRQGTPV